MLLPLLLLLQATTTPPDTSTRSADPRRAARFDSIAPRRVPGYSTPALARTVAEASLRNRRVPPALQGYTARVESEIGVVLRRAEGQEMVVGVEQTMSAVRWRRTGEYEQRVVGYRSRQVSVMPSVVGVAREPWTVPVLYGNRMVLLFGPDSGRTSARARSRERRRVFLAEHPLGEERDRFYTFSGGDTVQRIRVNGRMVEVLRIGVVPRGRFPSRVVLFSGTLDIDARRHQLVRMRGRFLQAGGRTSARERVVGAGFQALAFVELENAEVNGAWWLPSRQRIEVQATFPQLGDGRSVLRIVSHWRQLRVEATGEEERLAAIARGDTAGRPDPSLEAAGDTLPVRPYQLTFAPRDSLERQGDWAAEPGAATAAVRADDFDDVAPDRMRPTGRPRLDARVSRPSDLVHFNRVEGLYTGFGAELRMRDAAPGVTVRANVGYAWHEDAARGRAQVERTRGAWTVGARGGRQLELTNDFRAALDSGSTITALFGADDYDYVDRRSVAAFAARRVGAEGARAFVARAELAAVRDAWPRRALRCGIVCADSQFRENRGAAAGQYGRAVLELERDPDMATQGLRPGLGLLGRVEGGAGALDYLRVEARAIVRAQRGPFVLVGRGDAGLLAGGALPPQQLFELGGAAGGLAGYDYKEFAGDRALLGRAMLMWISPWLRRPIRVTRELALPGLQPGLSVGAQRGWTTTSDDAAAAAVRALGARTDPRTGEPVRDSSGVPLFLARPTDGARTSVDVRLRFFGGNASLGIARPLERGERWRLVAGLVQEL